MYQYKSILHLNEQTIYEDFVFGLKLKSGTQFKFLNCYVIFKRGNRGYSSENLTIEYYSNEDNDNKAYEEIKNAYNVLAYIFGIPLDEYRTLKKEVLASESINFISSINYDKVTKLKKISDKILRFKKGKDLFYHSLKLFKIAQRYSLMWGFNEDSYLNYFKIVENISTEEFNKIKQTNSFKFSKKEKREIESYITNLLEHKFKIRYTDNKSKDITGKMISNLLKLSTDSVYFNIYSFANKNNIPIDTEELQKAIKVRNKIAHGNYIKTQELKDSYGFIQKLCLEVMSKKFFKKEYLAIHLDVHFKTC